MIIFIQPAFPLYRKCFFDKLFAAYKDNFKLITAFDPSLGSLNISNSSYIKQSKMYSFGNLFFWQSSVFKLDMDRDTILVLPSNPRIISSLVIFIIAKLRGAKIIFWGHFHTAFNNTFTKFIRLCIARFADGMIFYTQDEVSLYSRTFLGKYDSRPICGLGNGLDRSLLINFCKPYDYDLRKGNIVFIGRITEKSKLPLLLNSISILSDSRITLTIIGSGPLLDHCHSLAVSLGINHQVKWLGEIIEESILSDILNKQSLFIYPGAVGLSLIHTMNYGIPCIVHSNPANHMPEFAAFRNHYNGVSFREDDVDDLSSVLNSTIWNPLLLTSYSKNCIETISNDYNCDVMSQKAISFLNSFIDC